MTHCGGSRSRGWPLALLTAALVIAGALAALPAAAQDGDTLQVERAVNPEAGTLGSVDFAVTLSVTADKAPCAQPQASRGPVDIVLALDRSASMTEPGSGGAGTKMDELKQAAKSFLKNVNLQTDQVGVVEFNDVADVVSGLTQDAAVLEAAIDGIVAEGGTMLDAGLNMAIREFETRGRPDTRRVIILLSDGVQNSQTDPEDTDVTGLDPVQVARAAQAQGIRIVTIGLGEIVDKDTLTQMASQPPDFYYAPAPNELPQVYKTIAEQVISQVAGATEVTVEHAVDPAFDVAPDSISAGGQLADGRITWQIPQVLDSPVTLSYVARPREAGSFSLAAGDTIAYRRCDREDRRISLPAGLPVTVAPPPTATPTPAGTATSTPPATRTPMPVVAPVATAATSGFASAVRGLVCAPSLWPALISLLILLFIILWLIRFYREWQKKPAPDGSGGRRLCPLWLWWMLPIVLLILGMALSRVASCQAAQSVYFWRIGSGSASSIYVTDVENRAAAREFAALSNGQCVGCHNVSPQGARIAAIEGGGTGQVVIYDLNGRPIQSPGIIGSYVALSPDGQQLAVSDANRDILIVDLASGSVTPLEGASDPSIAEQMPAWSPDASEIAFTRGLTSSNSWTFEGPCDIYVVPATGGEARPLEGASGDGFNYYPAYSPDGRWISFTRHTTGSTTYSAPEAEIFLVPSVGGERRRLAANDAANRQALTDVSNSWPTWSLDGRMIAFTSKRNDDNYDIFVATIDEAGNSGPAQPLNGASVQGIFEHTPYWGTPPQVDPWPGVLGLWPWLLLLLLPWLAYLFCKLMQSPPEPIRPEPAKVRPLPGRLNAPQAEALWQVAPTLLIGVGGTGRWVLTQVKKAMNDGGGGAVPSNVRFLLLDTSEREQTNLFRGRDNQVMKVEFAGTSLDANEVYLVNENLFDLLRETDARPDAALDDWFPRNEYRSMPAPQVDLAAGTHGRRPMARAGLILKLRGATAAQTAAQPAAKAEPSRLRENTEADAARLRDASELWSALVAACGKVQDEGLVRIILVGSLAGGMGGTLYDAAYLVRKAARSVAPRAHLEGYLTLPRAFRSAEVNRPWLEINTIAAARELERFQLSQGYPFPMTYSAQPGAAPAEAPQLDGVCDWRLFDDVTLFSANDGARLAPGKSAEPWATTFASMADVITLRMDRATAAGSRHDYRSGTRAAGEAKQANTGSAVVSSAGSFVYRLPLMDILEVVRTRWARKLAHVFLNGDLETADISFDPAQAGMAEPPDSYAFKFVVGQHEAGDGPAGIYAVGDLFSGRPVRSHHLQDLGEARGRRYGDYLGAALGLILNGYKTDDEGKLQRRSPSIGYAQAFAERVVLDLRKAETTARDQAANAPTSSLGLKNRILLLFRRGVPTQREWRIAADRLHEWGNVTQRAVDSLANLRLLLTGREGTPTRPRIPGLYSELVDRQQQAEARREQMDQIAVRKYLWARPVDPDRNPADPKNWVNLYDDWYQQLDLRLNEHLGRFYWYTEPEGAVRLGLVIEQSKGVVALDDRRPDAVQALANEIHRLAEHLTSEWAAKTRLIDVIPTLFSSQEPDPAHRLLEETWDLSLPHLRPAVGVSQEIDGQRAAAMGIPEPVREHHRMRELLTLVGDLGTHKARVASHLKPCKTDVIGTTDHTAMALIREDTQMPLPFLPDYLEAWRTYRRNAGRAVEPTVESPLLAAVFGAERLALEFERRLEHPSVLNQDFRLLHPLVVLAFAHPEPAANYALAFAAGWVARGANGAVLTIPGAGEFDLTAKAGTASGSLTATSRASGVVDYRVEGLLRVATAPANDPVAQKLAAALREPDAVTLQSWRRFFGAFQEIALPEDAPRADQPVCVNGHPMTSGKPYCKVCGGIAQTAAPQPAVNVCLKGHELQPDKKFCKICGSPARPQTTASAPAPAPAAYAPPTIWQPTFAGEMQSVQDLAAVAALLVYRRLSPGTWSDLVMDRSRKA